MVATHESQEAGLLALSRGPPGLSCWADTPDPLRSK